MGWASCYHTRMSTTHTNEETTRTCNCCREIVSADDTRLGLCDDCFHTWVIYGDKPVGLGRIGPE